MSHRLRKGYSITTSRHHAIIASLVIAILLLAGCSDDHSMKAIPNHKVIVAGFDGADFRIIMPLVAMGKLPGFEILLEKGAYGRLKSTTPPLSPAAWTSAITGVNPGKHNIYRFFKSVPGVNGDIKMVFTNSYDRKCKAIWELIETSDKRTIAINIPSTSPATPINGILLSGFPFYRQGNLYYPPDITSLIQGYRFEMADVRFSVENPRHFANYTFESLIKRYQVSMSLLEEHPWHLFWVVYTSLDRIQHHYWRYFEEGFEETSLKDRNQFKDIIYIYYRGCSNILLRIMENLSPETDLVVMSDHGFGAVKHKIIVGDILKNLYDPQKNGFLAFYVENGFMINLADRYPDGIVQTKDYQAVRKQVAEYLASLKDKKSGKPYFRTVAFKEDIYHGPCLDNAADIVIEENGGFLLYGVTSQRMLDEQGYMRDIFSGYHQPYGIFLAHGPGIAQGRQLEGMHIMDIAPNILYLLGEPIPSYMDGRWLANLYDDYYYGIEPRYVDIPMIPGFKPSGILDSDTRRVKGQLESIGYLR